jgi:hypothetical protein
MGEAEEWLQEAMDCAEEHRFSQRIFEAERALAEIRATSRQRDRTQAAPGADPGAGMLEVRRGLRRMREALTGADGLG